MLQILVTLLAFQLCASNPVNFYSFDGDSILLNCDGIFGLIGLVLDSDTLRIV